MYTAALTKMYDAKRAGGFDLPHEMEARCVRYFHEHPDLGGEAGRVASTLVKEFELAERRLTRLAALPVATRGRGGKDLQVQQTRMSDLCESVVQLYEDLGC